MGLPPSSSFPASWARTILALDARFSAPCSNAKSRLACDISSALFSVVSFDTRAARIARLNRSASNCCRFAVAIACCTSSSVLWPSRFPAVTFALALSSVSPICPKSALKRFWISGGTGKPPGEMAPEIPLPKSLLRNRMIPINFDAINSIFRSIRSSSVWILTELLAIASPKPLAPTPSLSRMDRTAPLLLTISRNSSFAFSTLVLRR